MYDVAVIGSGPGGYVAAIRFAQLGFKTVCVEKNPSLGGTCLNIGCIPSKALLHTTELYALMKHGAPLGFDAGSLSLNFETMMQRKDSVVKGLTDGVRWLFKKNGVEVLFGTAKITSPNEFSIEGKTYPAKYIILATGSEPIALPFLPFDEKRILSSTGALALPSIPKKMIVIGAGVIGVELGSVYSRLGTEVVFVEMLDHICGNLDPTIHQHLIQILTKQGLTFHLSSTVKRGNLLKDKVVLEIEENKETKTLEGDVVLVGVGRRPYSAGLDLDKVGVKLSPKGFVIVDANFRTSIPSIFAIGDLIEGPMLAHRASEEGTVLAEIVAGQSSTINYMTLPNIIYTHPEVATVGFTEPEAKEMGMNVITGTCLVKANPRARCMGDTDGIIKVVADKDSGRILGVHLLSPQASELISEGVLAIQSKMTVEELANTFHGHPTISEAIKEACLVALGRPINI